MCRQSIMRFPYTLFAVVPCRRNDRIEKRHVDERFGTNHALERKDLPSLLLQQDDACRATRHGKICGFSVRNVIRGRLKLFAVTAQRRGKSAI